MAITPKTTAAMPVRRKLGRIVMAGSQAFQISSGTQGGPMELIMTPAGATSPCMISKMPCSMLPIAAKTPKEAATTLVALFMWV